MEDIMKDGLATVCSHTALSFAFTFLKRTWRSGEDNDLCRELLQDTTDALRLELIVCDGTLVQ